jgi:HlyD family secretion protein
VNAIVKQARQSITVVGRVVSAAQRRVADGTGNTFSDDTLQFLEPIDQITEASPPRFMRSTLYVILAMVLTGLVISSIVKIDLVVVGRGTLTTEHAPMVLQPFDRSIIRDVQVRPGDTVHKGQVLATLDSTFAQADLSTLTSQQRGVTARIERIQAELADQPFDPGTKATAEELLQATLYHENMNRFRSRISALDQDINGLAANIRTTEEDRASLDKELQVAKEVEGMRGQLLASQNGSKLNFLEAQTMRMRAERTVQDAGNRLKEMQYAMQSKKAERQAFVDEWRRDLTEALVAARTEETQIDQGMSKASLVNNLVMLTAPEDGVVLDVVRKSVGSIVGAGEALVTIAPSSSRLVADITINSGDIGYIHAGENVVLKVDAFPYQRHGLLNGKLLFVTEQSFATGQDPDAGSSAVGSPSGGAAHRGRVELTNTDLRNLPPGAGLIPGMTLSAEIKVGSRRAITFFVYPLVKGFGESLREP